MTSSPTSCFNFIVTVVILLCCTKPVHADHRELPDYCNDTLTDQWLPYEKVVTKCDMASWYYELGTLDALFTSEWSSEKRKTTPTMLATDTMLLEDAMFPYECENSAAMDFSTDDSHIFGQTKIKLTPQNHGFTIDGWIWLKYSSEDLEPKNPYGGERTQTIISSWGMHSRAWKVFVDERDSLGFAWNNNEKRDRGRDRIRICRTEARRVSLRRWHHFAVRYDDDTDLITIYLNATSQRADISDDESVTCRGVDKIASNLTLETSIGATWEGGRSSDNFVGAMAKIAVYNHAVGEERLRMHYERAFGDTLPSPCNKHGDCVEESETEWKCACEPIYFGDTCTDTIELVSVTPAQGSMFGGTTITLKGVGFHKLKVDSDPDWTPEVRIGATITHHDNWAGVDADYGTCKIISHNAFTIVCETGPWSGRGPQNVSVVVPDYAGYPRARPVFSTCQRLSDCQFLPAIDATPRIWTHERWATPGALLTFLGQHFLYDQFELTFGDASEGLNCELQNYTDTSFSCLVPSTQEAVNKMVGKRFQMHLKMKPLGYGWPMVETIYIHASQMTIYPLYRVDSRNRNCPRDPAQDVTVFSTDYKEPLKDKEIRIYEAPCTKRRISEYEWLRDKVPDDYWTTFGMEGCPPYLRHFHEENFIPSAFALVPENQVDWSKKYKQRQFIDASGHRHCLFMEVDLDTCDNPLYNTPTKPYYHCAPDKKKK
eukprot:TRINITY_DN64886_c0_g1_i1.p1 TRINITY_DN64886_c0_g1~~TRINITY_DN64886_c0_g1_i1.p1  ORF type:complete len:714 (+),score=21.23 TRINITY_DN64886_c0_g1_i1:66-2207(+)